MKRPVYEMALAMGYTPAEAEDKFGGEYSMADAIRTARPPVGSDDENSYSYDACAEYAANCLLRAAGRDPITFGVAADAYRANSFSRDLEKLMLLNEQETILKGRMAVTGFQWGWAVNAVLEMLEQPGGGNPAILKLAQTVVRPFIVASKEDI